MTRTINEKTVSDIFAGLAVAKPCVKYLDGKYPYHEISEYVERMDAVIGKEHYAMHYDECRMIELPNTQSAFVIKCTITVFDDEGNPVPVLSAEGFGSSEIKKNKDGNFLHLNNVPLYARQAAFKDACRRYGIFGESDMEADSSSQSGNTGKKQGDKGQENKKGQQAVLETFVTEGTMTVIRQDAQSGKPVYELLCYKKCGSEMEDHASTVIFYPNQYRKQEELLKKFVDLVSDGKPHIVTLKYSPASRAGGLVFKGFK